MDPSLPKPERASDFRWLIPFIVGGLLGGALAGGALVLGWRWWLDDWRQSTPVSQARVAVKPHVPIVILSDVQLADAAAPPQILKVDQISNSNEVFVDLDDTVSGAIRVYTGWAIHVARPGMANEIQLTIRDEQGAAAGSLTVSASSSSASALSVFEPVIESGGSKDNYHVTWVTLDLFGKSGKFAVLDK